MEASSTAKGGPSLAQTSSKQSCKAELVLSCTARLHGTHWQALQENTAIPEAQLSYVMRVLCSIHRSCLRYGKGGSDGGGVSGKGGQGGWWDGQWDGQPASQCRPRSCVMRRKPKGHSKVQKTAGRD